MAKKTLLEIVQSICNSLNLDDVNSLSDTVESVQISQMAEDVFWDFITTRDWSHLRHVRKLDQMSDLSRPTTLALPANTARLESLNYNMKRRNETRDNWRPVQYLYPEDFLRITNARNSDQDHIQVVTVETGVEVLVRNDKQPRYWTSFDDKHIVMDAYDVDIEDTLRGENTQAVTYELPSWSQEDEFVPDLPALVFPGYMAELKSVCSLEINEQANQKAEQQAMRHRRRMANASWRAHENEPEPDYGRSGVKGGQRRNRNPLFQK